MSELDDGEVQHRQQQQKEKLQKSAGVTVHKRLDAETTDADVVVVGRLVRY